jgi:N-acetylglucosamine kinase-like BadF-type ATPase
MITISPISADQTIRIFDSFYSTNLVINASAYDMVHSYFVETCESQQIADNFTAIVFRIAQEGNYNPIDILELLKGTNSTMKMNSVLCFYLNTFKEKVTLYGVSNTPKPNESVQRNVVL